MMIYQQSLQQSLQISENSEWARKFAHTMQLDQSLVISGIDARTANRILQSEQFLQYIHENPEGHRKAALSRGLNQNLVSGGIDAHIAGRIVLTSMIVSFVRQESIEEYSKNLRFIKESVIGSHYYEESSEESFQSFGETSNFVRDKIEERTPEPETESEAEVETDIEVEAEPVLPDPVTEVDDPQIISEPVLPDPVFEFYDPLTGSEPTQFEGARETFDPLTNPNPISEGTVSEFIEPDAFGISGSAGTVIEPIDGLQGFSTDGFSESSEEQLQADLVNSMAAPSEVLA
jgi:hypothetical protein